MRIGFACLGVVAAVTVAQGKTEPALDKLTAAFTAAFNAKDAAKVAAFYAEDAVLMPPNGPLVTGRPDIEAYYRNGFAQGIPRLARRPLESSIVGAQAVEAGTSTWTIDKPPSLPLVRGVAGGHVDKGKYVVVYKRVSNDWKIAFEIFNADTPSAPVSR